MKQHYNFIHFRTNIKLIVILIIGLQINTLSAQNKRMIHRANNLFGFSQFNEALPLYLDLLKEDPKNFLYNYRTAMCYLNSNIETNKCLGYFEIAKANIKSPNDSTPDFYYFLGHAYQIRNQFDNALKYLNLSKTMLDGKKDSLNIYFINLEIEQCNNGNKMMSSPTNARLFNLGKNINTIYPDYSPMITPDQSTLVFTSTRIGSTGGRVTAEQGDYFEDIYTSKNLGKDTSNIGTIETSFYEPDFIGAHFAPAINAGELVNTKSHDASISLTPDGKKLYLYRRNAVWQSDLINGIISPPLKFDYVVDGKKRTESSLTTSADQKTLYFVSEQTGGIGGKDIYRSTKQLDGTWGPAENLGPMVNTEFDEEAPYFDSNEGVLYFSSQGHNSIGGFDVFKTKFDNDVWMKPKNMGYPINSGTDDVFYSFDIEQNRGLISTMRDDAIGNYDIYMVRNLKPMEVLFTTTYSNGLKPIEGDATIRNSKTNEVSKIKLNDISVPKYNPLGKYKMLVPRYDSSNQVNEFEFETPESYGDYTYYQEINYDIVKNHKDQLIGYKTTVYNAFFDIDKEVKKAKGINRLANKPAVYSAFVKPLRSENQYFQVLSKVNYIDTSIYAIQEEEVAAKALAGTLPEATLVSKKGKETKTTKTTKVTKAAKTIVEKAETAVVSTNQAVGSAEAFKTVLFHFSKVTLSKEAKAEVKNIAQYLKENKDVKMEIIGYTDSKGKSKFNRELSKKRADVIKSMLVKNGIKASRLKTKGMGEKNPVAPNFNDDKSDNLEGRKLNRRVEFVIVNGK